jgi:hypothetical protein
MHLVNEAVNNKVDVFVFTSSIAVYGTNQASVSYRSLGPRLRQQCGLYCSFSQCNANRSAPSRSFSVRLFVCVFATCGTAARTGVYAEAVVASTIVRQ